MAFCAYCGRELPLGSSFWPSCGKPVTTVVPPTTGPAPSNAVMSQPYGQTEIRPNYAGEVERSVAAIIDLIIVGIFSLVIIIPLGIWNFFFRGAAFGLWGLNFLALWLFLVLYYTYFDAKTGQSIGKQLLKIRTVDETTLKPLDFERSLVRNIFRIIDILPLLYFIGIIVIVLDRQKRRLGDIAAHSIVIKA